MRRYILAFFIGLFLLGCNSNIQQESTVQKFDKIVLEKEITPLTKTVEKPVFEFDQSTKTIHILVALCDNKYQGIVLVPAKIGNGQDPDNNLYWGTAYGIKTYFKRSKEWTLISSEKQSGEILERLVFKHKTSDYYLVADAYDGQYIKQTTQDFLANIHGQDKDTLNINNTTIGINGNANLVAYIGHDGLMDFELSETYKNTDGLTRSAIILACYSKSYFTSHLDQKTIQPLVWTTGLMAPEAYTIHDALSVYIKGQSNEEIQLAAANAYAKYQKCSVKAAKRLLVSGW